jgi:hypothetical protein
VTSEVLVTDEVPILQYEVDLEPCLHSTGRLLFGQMRDKIQVNRINYKVQATSTPRNVIQH